MNLRRTDILARDRVLWSSTHYEIVSVLPNDKPVSAGELNTQIQLERDTITRDHGAEVRTPAVYDTVWAKAEPLSGREYWQAQAVQSQVSWKFTIRGAVLMCRAR